ncbi:MAG: dihydropyrimidinase, partial [Alphaproteobacteria bacterium]
LYPRKGTIAVGSDADIAIWDPKKQVTISTDSLHDAMDYTPYEGFDVTGWPETVISRGDVIVRDIGLDAAPGRGAFLPCGRPDPTPPVGIAVAAS